MAGPLGDSVGIIRAAGRSGDLNPLSSLLGEQAVGHPGKRKPDLRILKGSRTELPNRVLTAKSLIDRIKAQFAIHGLDFFCLKEFTYQSAQEAP
jgi:hypothetical protein